MLKEVILYCDGACSGNPGPGGWACVLDYRGNKKELSGFVADTTNNRMELMAALQGLLALKERCSVKVYTDSAYIHNAFDKGWIIAVSYTHLDVYKRQFVDRLIDGKPFLVSTEDAANTSLALLAVLESAAKREPVTVQY